MADYLPTILATSYSASFLPTVLVPVIGWVFPAVAMAFLFIYIERDDAAGL